MANLIRLIDDLEACVQKARQSGLNLLDLIDGIKFDALFSPDGKLKKGIKFPGKAQPLESDLWAVAIAISAI